MLLICPARGKLLRRVGKYLAANVRMSFCGRQRTTFSALLLLQWEVMVGGADFHLPQRGLLPRAEAIEIALGGVVFQTCYHHEDADGCETVTQ